MNTNGMDTTTVPIRMKDTGVKRLDALVAKHGVSRSAVIRAVFRAAFAHPEEIDVYIKAEKKQKTDPKGVE